MIADGIPDRERAFRDDALLYLISRYERASTALSNRQVTAFREFVNLWLETFDWRTPEGVARYLQLGEEQRLERFERFRRQAASWDVTLEFPITPVDERHQERGRWRDDFERTRERLRERAAKARSHWETVRELLEAEHRLRRMPSWLQESFRFLDLPPRASLADARKRYRELARRYHPDASGSTEQMASLNDAWTKVESFFLE